MAQILGKKFPALILCAALLLMLCGCGRENSTSPEAKENPFPGLPLDSESVASLEAAYGKSIHELEEEWDFLMEDLVEELTGSGIWSLDRKIEAEGKDFWQSLLVNKEDMLTGFWFRLYCDSAEEAAEIAEVLYRAAVEEYGEPHDKNLSGRLLTRENAFDEMRKYDGCWGIMWPVGEISYLDMLVRMNDVDVGTNQDRQFFSIELTYRVLPEEWHRFVPGYEARFPMGPIVRGE